jgi:hypothetical protein
MSAKAVFRVVQPPAMPDEIAALRSGCGILPESYVDFLTESNGAEWGVHDQGGDCLALWTTK